MNKRVNNFSREDFLKSARILNMSNISLLDVKYIEDRMEEEYKLSSNCFIFSSGGKFKLALDDVYYNVEKFGLFHGKTGSSIDMKSLDGSKLEYYMVLYKGEKPLVDELEYDRLLGEFNPFDINYGFIPSNSILFAEMLRTMYARWESYSEIDILYCKKSFLDLIYLIHEELIDRKMDYFEPDVVDMAILYLDKNYSKNISIQELCKDLGISYSHFHRIFKQKIGQTPQEYLINNRMEESINLLKNSDASIREVAEICGFQDERNLQRAFSKKLGKTPNSFRENLTCRKVDIDIVKNNPFAYNEKYNMSELKWKGVNYMFRQMTKEALIAVTLSLLLFLTACGTSAPDKKALDTDGGNGIEVTTSENGTRIIETEMGKVEIPAEPKRVVATIIQGDVLALDIVPVGTSFNDGAVFLNDLEESQVINAFAINPEEIMALDPDLILWNTNNFDGYDDLSKIAPTIAYDYFGMDHKERLRFLGEILNRSEKAEELIADFDKKVEDSRLKLKESGYEGKTALCMEKREDLLSVAWLGRGGPLMYDLLGFKMPPKIEEASKDTKNSSGGLKLSYEVMDEYTGDVILINGDLGEFGNNNIWKNQTAVKEGNVIYAPSNMFWFNDILSMNGQVDLIIDNLTK